MTEEEKKGTWYSDKELLEYLRRLNGHFGEPPSSNYMRDHGQYTHVVYYQRFGSWKEALKAAGIEPRPDKVPEEVLLDDVREVADITGGPPSITDYERHGRYAMTTYRRRFGSFTDALIEAGLIRPAD